MSSQIINIHSFQIGRCLGKNSLEEPCSQFFVHLQDICFFTAHNLCRRDLHCPQCKTIVDPETFGYHPLSMEKHRWINSDGEWQSEPVLEPFEIILDSPPIETVT